MSICANALKALGHILYNMDYPNDQRINEWAKVELAKVANEIPIVDSFWSYINSEWLQKTNMWVVGNYNMPYVGQDTNATIENYYTNLKPPFIPPRANFMGEEWIRQYMN